MLEVGGEPAPLDGFTYRCAAVQVVAAVFPHSHGAHGATIVGPPGAPGARPVALTVSVMPERLLVIGGDAAGMSAATQARRRAPDLEIVALERGRWTSYSACGIPYLVGGAVHALDDLIARSPEEFRLCGSTCVPATR